MINALVFLGVREPCFWRISHARLTDILAVHGYSAHNHNTPIFPTPGSTRSPESCGCPYCPLLSRKCRLVDRHGLSPGETGTAPRTGDLVGASRRIIFSISSLKSKTFTSHQTSMAIGVPLLFFTCAILAFTTFLVEINLSSSRHG